MGWAENGLRVDERYGLKYGLGKTSGSECSVG